MSEDLGLPCVIVRCKASGGKLFVWQESMWDEDEQHYLNTGRKLILRAPMDTCKTIRDLMEQQEKENAN